MNTNNLVIESLLLNDNIIKNANGSLSNIPDMLKSYVTPDKQNAAGVISLLIPGTLFMLLSGHPVLRILFAVASSYYQIEIKEIIGSMLNTIKPDLASGKKISEEKIDQAAEAATADVGKETKQKSSSEEPNDEFSLENDGMNTNSSYNVKDIRKLSLALIAYSNDNSELQFSKYALKAGVTALTTRFALKTIFSWVFKIILASAGFLIVGSLLREVIQPTSEKKQKEDSKIYDQPLVVATQTKFKINPSYTDTHNADWEITMLADKQSIENMIINFAKEVYLGLDDADNVIKSTSTFGVVVLNILRHNKFNVGYNLVIMPKIFTSKKQIVDTFIDEVAKNSP